MSNNTQTTPVSLGTDSLPALLARYAIPAIIATTSASLYNITDSIFIGQGVGPLALSGLAVTMPMMNISAAFGAMVGVGASALVSIRLGQGNRRSAMSILGNVVLLNVLLGVVFAAVCLAFLDGILGIFGASPDTLPYAREYMSILLYGNAVTHLYLGLNNVVRASGYPKRSMGIMLVAVAVNCVLDPLFIFVFKWGIAGSAIATVIAQCVAMGCEIVHFTGKKSFLRFEPWIFRLRWKIITGILSIGMAPFLIQTCACIVVIFINNSLKNHGGDLYIGAYGIINRVVMLFVMVVVGLNQGMQPIVGYNYGARRMERVIGTLKLTVRYAMAVTTAGFLICELFPHQVVTLFLDEAGEQAARLVEVAQAGLRVTVLAFPIVGFQIVTANFFQYIGKPNKAIVLSLTRQMLFLVPLLAFLPGMFGHTGVWMSMPIADVLSTLLAAVLIVAQVRKLRSGEDRSI